MLPASHHLAVSITDATTWIAEHCSCLAVNN